MTCSFPADFDGSHGSIRPFSGSAWDHAHFSVEDWHVILIADIEGGESTFKQKNASAIMDALTVTFTLDGAGLATTRTATKRFTNPDAFGLDAAYYFQQARVMAPTDLAIGSHTLSVAISGATGRFQDQITFWIDAP